MEVSWSAADLDGQLSAVTRLLHVLLYFDCFSFVLLFVFVLGSVDCD